MLSWWHWLIIIAAFILLFGAKRLPDAARGLGRSLRILKSEVGAMSEDDKDKRPAETDASAARPTAPAQIAPATVQAGYPQQAHQQPVPAQPQYQQPVGQPEYQQAQYQQPVQAQPAYAQPAVQPAEQQAVPAPQPEAVPVPRYEDPTRPAGT